MWLSDTLTMNTLQVLPVHVRACRSIYRSAIALLHLSWKCGLTEVNNGSHYNVNFTKLYLKTRVLTVNLPFKLVEEESILWQDHV